MVAHGDPLAWLARLDLHTVRRIFADSGAKKLLVKSLSPNDNSKNQVYLGGDLSEFPDLPCGPANAAISMSRKPGKGSSPIFRAFVKLRWLQQNGESVPAVQTKLIFYPQYPEVRLSGFLAGCSAAPSELFNSARRGREEGRVLVLGVSDTEEVYALALPPESPAAHELHSVVPPAENGILIRMPLSAAVPLPTEQALFEQLCRVHRKGWITGWQLRGDGTRGPCYAPNCGGLTLEAELGVGKNSRSDPDLLGWEIKQICVPKFDVWPSRPVTLFTPEPDGGYYTQHGSSAFIRKFGYPAVKGIAHRTNFGGRHKLGVRDKRTKLTLMIHGADQHTGVLTDATGSIALVTLDGSVAASWTFAKLIQHWKNKHENVVYVQSQVETGSVRRYRYGSRVLIGQGAEFRRLILACVKSEVYYDPGLKLIEARDSKPERKTRHQFRINLKKVSDLYRSSREVNVCSSYEEVFGPPDVPAGHWSLHL